MVYVGREGSGFLWERERAYFGKFAGPIAAFEHVLMRAGGRIFNNEIGDVFSFEIAGEIDANRTGGGKIGRTDGLQLGLEGDDLCGQCGGGHSR
ncbi:MAG: hypothetical protein WA826_09155, partial [Silvibacterium sp.]